MGRGKGKPAPKTPDPLVTALQAAVVGDRHDDTIIIIIPSHDSGRPQKELTDQEFWADAGLRLFSKLYGGATAFMALRGVWKSPDGTDLFDEPIMIQSLANREDAENEAKLEELIEFARRMCRETRQECVAVMCNDTIHFIGPT
jgi:hypothetical protein